MSLSKRLYESGYRDEPKCNKPLLNTGQRFVVDSGIQKNIQGTWEIVNNEQAPFYKCRRILKDGTLSRSDSLYNYRDFYEPSIYRALN